MNSVLILSDNSRFSLPVVTSPHLWAAGLVGQVNMINERTGNGSRWLPDKIMTVYEYSASDTCLFPSPRIFAQHGAGLDLRTFRGHLLCPSSGS